MSRISQETQYKLDTFIKNFIEEFNKWDEQLKLLDGNVIDNDFVVMFQVSSIYLNNILLYHQSNKEYYFDDIKHKIRDFIEKEDLKNILNYVSIYQDYINIYLSEVYVRKLEDPKYNP